ncbi:hypothetical protein [Streptomyces sp. URMC 123]|uniref:hypothetical protein n=1 Tax=Streptomyces sp. URMC 123 TaxID=3423403 RepID=UPI003F1B982B
MAEESQRRNRREDKPKPIVVSVRFPDLLLQQVHAYAAVMNTTANAFIREAVADSLREKIRTPEFKAATEAHLRRAQATVAVLGVNPDPHSGSGAAPADGGAAETTEDEGRDVA